MHFKFQKPYIFAQYFILQFFSKNFQSEQKDTV